MVTQPIFALRTGNLRPAVQIIVRAFRDRVRGHLAGQLEQLAGKGNVQAAGASHTSPPDMRAVHDLLGTLQQLVQVRRRVHLPAATSSALRIS